MQDLNRELYSARVLLKNALKISKERGVTLAETEHAYKSANARFILNKRADGVPATLIKELALGDKVVGGLRLQRDIAKTLYENVNEAINVYKLEVRVVEGQISREWHSGNTKD